MSQARTVASVLPVKAVWLGASSTRHSTAPVWPRRVWWQEPLATCHTFAVPSVLPVTSSPPAAASSSKGAPGRSRGAE